MLVKGRIYGIDNICREDWKEKIMVKMTFSHFIKEKEHSSQMTCWKFNTVDFTQTAEKEKEGRSHCWMHQRYLPPDLERGWRTLSTRGWRRSERWDQRQPGKSKMISMWRDCIYCTASFRYSMKLERVSYLIGSKYSEREFKMFSDDIVQSYKVQREDNILPGRWATWQN